MPKRVELHEKEVVFEKLIFKVEQAKLRHEKFDGTMSKEITRLNLERGDGVAAVIHNEATDTVILIEQFRYSTYEKGPGWLLELPAGIVDDKDDSPAKTMQREVLEEVGYEVEELRHIHTFYLSPGGSSERIFLYYASITEANKTTDGGGLEEEGEDIRTLELTTAQAFEKLDNAEIRDAKTIIGLQWLRLHLGR
jgi:nudix-type nucleoside diphosphatase (YffH/AdpP family)